MNIIYCICGDGNGHVFRSNVIIEHLKQKGHKVSMLASGKAYGFLAPRYQEVAEISGLKLSYQDNRVKKSKTIASTIFQVKDLPHNIKALRSLVKDYHPDIVISDMEPIASLIAAIYNIPLISLDNNHMLADTKFHVSKKDFPAYVVGKVFMDSVLPSRDFSILTTFFYPPLRRRKQKNTVLVPPIIRQEVMQAKPTVGSHILVYQTSDGYKELLNVLKASNRQYIIYNGNREIKADNLLFRDFSPTQIVADLAGAAGVITNGGFSLISEALYLGKPIMCLPIKNQFEQIINGHMLETLGYGQMSYRLTRQQLESWLEELTVYRQNVKKIVFDNRIVFNKLDEALKAFVRPKY